MSKPLYPSAMVEFKKDRQKFEAWLLSHGSEIREPSNQYEILRFTTMQGVGVIYRDLSGAITSWQNGASEAWKAFKLGDDKWRMTPKVKRNYGNAAIRHQIGTIIRRDGDECWYCGGSFGGGELQRTREHLVSLIHKGPDHLSNLVVAHEKCNHIAGNMSVADKVRLREKLRSEAKTP